MDTLLTDGRAVAASIAPLLAPRSVVVIGAGRGQGGAGRALLHNLHAGAFPGELAAVNHRAVEDEMIAGVRAYRTVAEVGWVPDLAVIAVPAAAVAGVLAECGAVGVRGAVVISSGFAEAGNAEAEAELVRIAHRHGLRLIGPNCLGVLNTDPAICLDATFARTTPAAAAHGGVGLAAQSVALGVSVLDAARQRGIGTAGFVSLGNKADVSGNDMLLYWAGDPRATVIALYLESIGNPRRFRRIAAEVARVKPVVALRSGRAAATAALYRDAGVIAAESTEEFVDIVMLLSTQPVPAGRRVVVVGNAGGPAALAADAAHDAGAVLPALSDRTVTRLRAVVGAATDLRNPIDLGVDATPADYAQALGVLRAGGEADALVIIHVATGAQPTSPVVRAIEQAQLDAGRQIPGADPRPPITVAAAMIGAPPPAGGVLPWYGFAESAARAVAKAADLGQWRARRPEALPGSDGTAVPAGIDREAVAALLASAPRADDGWLDPAAATELLRVIGVPVRATAPAEMVGQAGQELLLGLSLPAGGIPIVMVAAGGIHEDVLADRVYRTLPLAPGAAGEMVDEMRCAPVLHGHRGSPALDRAAVAETLTRIAVLDLIAPQIRELDVNPLVVGPDGVIALGARVRVAGPDQPTRRADTT